MVTICSHKKSGGLNYLRVRNTTREERATLEERLANGWMYCPKGEWKKNVRDRKKVE